jgi:hypothetical protein
MRILRISALSASLLFSASAAIATDLAVCNVPQEQWAELGCMCVMPIASPVALLDQVKGDVLKTEEASYTPIGSSPSLLEVGDKVLFSDNGEAIFSTLYCQQAVGPSASLVVYQLDESCACAALLEDPKPAKTAHHHGLAIGAASLLGLTILVHSISP